MFNVVDVLPEIHDLVPAVVLPLHRLDRNLLPRLLRYIGTVPL